MSPGLLIVHPGALGDVVLVFGLIRALRERFRPVGLLAQSGIAALAAAEDLADDAFALESAWTASLFAGMPDDRARARLSAYPRALAFARSAGLAASLQALAPGGVCTVPPRPPLISDVHAATHAWAAAHACGLLPANAPKSPPLRPYRPKDGSSPVFLHPGSGSPRKRWPIDRFLAVAAALQARGRRPEVILGPADFDLRPYLVGRYPLHPPRTRSRCGTCCGRARPSSAMTRGSPTYRPGWGSRAWRCSGRATRSGGGRSGNASRSSGRPGACRASKGPTRSAGGATAYPRSRPRTSCARWIA